MQNAYNHKMSTIQGNTVRLALGTLALTVCAAWGAEPEWPRFRGPDSNRSAGRGRLPEKWSKTENVEWTAEIPGRGWSSPIVNGLDIQNGKTLWRREFYSGQPPGGRHRKNSFASETPVTDGRLIYVYIANLGLYAFDIKGAQVWHTPLEAYPIYLDFGTGGSPALFGERLSRCRAAPSYRRGSRPGDRAVRISMRDRARRVRVGA
jgi:outer membrane protein assembly factor BamB